MDRPASLPAPRTRPAGRTGRPAGAAPPSALRRATRAAPFLLLAALSAGGAALVYYAAVGTAGGRALDAAGLLEGWRGTELPRAHAAASELLGVIDIGSLALFTAALGGFALLRGRARLAAGAVVLIGGANVSTQLLKRGLGAVDPVGGETARALPAIFPSGHATIAMSLALALVLVAPPAMRLLAALAGTGYATAMGVALMAMGWHYPSDVAGGYLVAATWAALVSSVLVAWPERPAPATAARRRLAIAGAAGALVLAVAIVAGGGLVLLNRPDLLLFGRAHTAFAAASVALACLGAALLGLLAAMLLRVAPEAPAAPRPGAPAAPERPGRP